MNEVKVQDEVLPEQIKSAIASVVGDSPVGLHEPSFEGNEWRYLKECLDSTFVSSVGKFVDRFESDLTDFTGAKYAVAVVNGTSALHVALMLADVRRDDEVLIPSLTFIATANAVSYCGAVPHFIDSEDMSFGIAAGPLKEYLRDNTKFKNKVCFNKKTGRPIKALVPMHTFGHPVNLDDICAIADEFNLALVEDAAESLGTLYGSRHTGTFGLLGVLSFNGNKTITTGGGGAILTNDRNLAIKAKHLTTTAKVPHRWNFYHDEIGFNYRMPNINAAIGCAQLEQLESKLQSKRLLFKLYKSAFDHIPGIKLFKEPESCKSNYWLQTIILDENQMSALEEILEVTNNLQIKTRPVWDILSDLNPFKNYPKMDLENARSLSRRIINIPSSPNIINS